MSLPEDLSQIYINTPEKFRTLYPLKNAEEARWMQKAADLVLGVTVNFLPSATSQEREDAAEAYGQIAESIINLDGSSGWSAAAHSMVSPADRVREARRVIQNGGRIAMITSDRTKGETPHLPLLIRKMEELKSLENTTKLSVAAIAAALKADNDGQQGQIESAAADKKPRFREIEPIELWSARLDLAVPYADFEQTVIRIAQENTYAYTGFVTKDSSGNVTSFTGTRYPRKKYGIPEIDKCRTGMIALSRELISILRFSPQSSDIRVVLGLIEGYNDQGPVHDIAEVQQALPGAKVTPAEVFAVRLAGGKSSVYTEPAAVIEAPVDLISNIYELGESLRQERFTIENFVQGLTYVVETKFCTEPD